MSEVFRDRVHSQPAAVNKVGEKVLQNARAGGVHLCMAGGGTGP